MKKLTFSDVRKLCYKHNEENGITSQFEDQEPLRFVGVASNSNFTKEFDLESRSYEFVSSNKAFISRMGGNSIFATSLDKSDSIRLDWYLDSWKWEYFYQV